jgi:acetylornithine deacetylase/succinyl-diaminopimelate desuccinylase-like protein
MRSLIAVVVLAGVLCAQSSKDAAAAARRWREGHRQEILDEFFALLRLPNVARNVDDMRRNAAFIRQMFERRGVSTRLLEVEGAPPIVYGERLVPGASGTVMFYVHYDGQPVEPRMWTSGDPFRPVLTTDDDPRVYARSASDDKAPLIAFATAIDAMRAAKIEPAVNWKFFFDGEEEAGSPHLGAVLERYKDLLGADLWVFCDGPVHQSRQQQVVFGVRGVTTLQLTIYGPRRELHSGHYGNWAPNPARLLSKLLASMHDDTGHVLVRDFYSDVVPLGDAERKALAALPSMDAQLRKELLLAETEGDGRRLDELINQPALVIQGMSVAGVGSQTRNVVPDRAMAALGIRLVAGNDWRRMQDRVIEHVRGQGFHVVENEPDTATLLKHPRVCRVERETGYNAVREPMDSPAAKRVLAAVESARGPVLRVPTLGGSLPIAPIREVLRVPVIIVPIANHDNNQHGHNENIRVQNLWDGIETMASLLAMK